MLDIDATCDWIEDYLAWLVPEVAAPIYCVPDTRLPHRMTTVNGFTAPNLSWRLRPYLGAAWRGPGPAMVLAGQHTTGAGLGRDRALSTALHELGHCLVEDWPHYATDRPADRLGLETIMPHLDDYWQAYPHETAARPWAGHELPWIRAAVHLWWRAAESGHPLGLATVANTAYYGLSPCEEYLAALLDEVQAAAPLTSILGTRAPAEARRLWRADTGQRRRRAPRREPVRVVVSTEDDLDRIGYLDHDVRVRRRGRRKKTPRAGGCFIIG